jgi:dTDP-glucose pyrophosphorylase
MIERVLDNLNVDDADFTLIVQQAHRREHPEYFMRMQNRYACRYVVTSGVTEGACCTVLLARAIIDDNEPLLIANSDQLVDIDVEEFISDAEERRLHGSILTFPSDDTKWSYARTDDQGLVTEVKEKVVISSHATVGLYYFRRGRDFVAWADEMIAADDRVNGEFYVCPVYNYAIKNGMRIGIYEMRAGQMLGLGTPEDLDAYCDYAGITVR